MASFPSLTRPIQNAKGSGIEQNFLLKHQYNTYIAIKHYTYSKNSSDVLIIYKHLDDSLAQTPPTNERRTMYDPPRRDPRLPACAPRPNPQTATRRTPKTATTDIKGISDQAGDHTLRQPLLPARVELALLQLRRRPVPLLHTGNHKQKKVRSDQRAAQTAPYPGNGTPPIPNKPHRRSYPLLLRIARCGRVAGAAVVSHLDGEPSASSSSAAFVSAGRGKNPRRRRGGEREGRRRSGAAGCRHRQRR